MSAFIDPSPRVQPGEPGETAPAQRLPRNEDAEQALLGALLFDSRLIDKVADFLKPEHFYVGVHQRIFRAILAERDRGNMADHVTLAIFFDNDRDLTELGGGKYLADLAQGAFSRVSVVDYAKAIHDTYLRRELIALGQDIRSDAVDLNLDVSAPKLVENAEKRLYDLGEIGDGSGKGFVAFKESLRRSVGVIGNAMNRGNKLVGVTSGLRDLDHWLGGLHKGNLIIVAGRPGMGKTSLATNIGFAAARARALSNDGKDGATVGFFSLEMSIEDLTLRMLSEQTGISTEQIKRGEVRAHDYQKFIEAANDLSNLPFFIDETGSLSIAAIRTRARRLKRSDDLGLIILDYIQLAHDDDAENRVLEISAITRGLKALAKELELPIIALSQLNRSVEQREDKRPNLSDLRESGSIEQDADAVLFVYRDEYYLKNREPKKEPGEDDQKYLKRYADWQEACERSHNIAEVIIAKNRHGATRTVKLHFDGNTTRFSDLAPEGLDGSYEQGQAAPWS